MYVGNYEFWYESSQLVQRIIKQQNKRNEEKIRELQAFISRFSANKSKARQATSRRNLLEKLSVFDMPASSRRYPFIGFDMDREPGKDILTVKNLSAEVDGEVLFSGLSFMLAKNEKVAFVGNDRAITALFRILMEEEEPSGGEFKWGVSITKSYFPRDNTPYFEGCTDSILDWMRQYSSDQTESYLRNFLGRMLFSGDSVFKQVQVLSGGEKVRCMFSRMMLFGSNALLLDQPTNHLDLESITAVNNGLVDFKGNILFSSHDYEIVNTVANRIIEITPDGWQDFHGTYEEFVEAQKKKGVTNISL
jgi:ATPase subunit of ABC transporter with duplicated ATPase domains